MGVSFSSTHHTTRPCKISRPSLWRETAVTWHDIIILISELSLLPTLFTSEKKKKKTSVSCRIGSTIVSAAGCDPSQPRCIIIKKNNQVFPSDMKLNTTWRWLVINSKSYIDNGSFWNVGMRYKFKIHIESIRLTCKIGYPRWQCQLWTVSENRWKKSNCSHGDCENLK